jgi:predicted tellurium resistance membrane protein TerC
MKIIWIVLLAGFAAINIYAFMAGDLAGLVNYLTTLGPWATLGIVDLLIALFIGMAWMWRDAQGRGISPMPYLLLTLATGSIGLLVYLVRYSPNWARTPDAHGAA